MPEENPVEEAKKALLKLPQDDFAKVVIESPQFQNEDTRRELANDPGSRVTAQIHQTLKQSKLTREKQRFGPVEKTPSTGIGDVTRKTKAQTPTKEKAQDQPEEPKVVDVVKPTKAAIGSSLKEIVVALIHGTPRSKYSTEVRIPKVVVQALEILPGQQLYYRTENEDRIIFEKHQSESTQGTVTLAERGGGRGGTAWGIIIPAVLREDMTINEHTFLQVKLSGKGFVLEKAKTADQELADILTRAARKNEL